MNVSTTTTTTQLISSPSITDSTTQSPVTSTSLLPDATTTLTPEPLNDVSRFPYPVVLILSIWFLLALSYGYCRWRQKPKNTYIIPRVFVLCSPRTVQFHYELILRVGLPSSDFNPDKHDIDITLLGAQKNEVVPITRLNTKTLLDEPLITNLSLVVYRLVELPQIEYLVLRHSGHYKSWIYAYDFTIIDLTTLREQYFTLNTYIGSLERIVHLESPNNNISASQVKYPIDDVPMPKWSVEDIFLFLYFVINTIMLSLTLSPLTCSYVSDIFSVLVSALLGSALVFFLDWLFYYNLKWNQDRKEYFNDYESCKLCYNELVSKICVVTLATVIGFLCIYYAISINNWVDSLIWLLAVVDSCTLVIGIWSLSRQAEFGETLLGFGLRMRGTESVPVGMRLSELVQQSNIQHTKSGSSAGLTGSTISNRSRVARSVGPRSSVKSFGFDPSRASRQAL